MSDTQAEKLALDMFYASWEGTTKESVAELLPYAEALLALAGALKSAEQFMQPEIQRGPASNGWQNTVDSVSAALALAERVIGEEG